MRNFKDFTRAIAGIATSLKNINTVVEAIPVSSGGTEVSYSPEEHFVGKWYDGSDLYEKTIKIENVVSDTTSHGVDISDIYDGTNICFMQEAHLIGKTNQYAPLASTAQYYNGSIDQIRLWLTTISDVGNLRYNVQGVYGTLYVTLRYVKIS